MNNETLIKRREEICHCSGTTRTKIKELLAEGVTNLEDLSKRTGVVAGCGGCENLIQELIANPDQDD